MFVDYQKEVIANAQCLSKYLMEKGYDIVTGGTDIHLLLVNLKNKGTDGNRTDKVLEAVGIACNKNTCPGDKSALRPSGLRFGTPALTSRGFEADDFAVTADFIDQAVKITVGIQQSLPPKASFKDFKQMLSTDEETVNKINNLKAEVRKFAVKFPIPGLQLL